MDKNKLFYLFFFHFIRMRMTKQKLTTLHQKIYNKFELTVNGFNYLIIGLLLFMQIHSFINVTDHFTNYSVADCF